MQTLIQELRYSVRQLIKSPGFTLTAVISLALGMGATTAVLSVVYAALPDPYPFPAADRIVRMAVRTRDGAVEMVNLTPPQIQQLRQVRAIENMLAMDYHAMTMTGRDLPENVNVIGLISNGFDDLGVPPVLGRGLQRSDAIDGQDPQPVAVLSYKFWQERLGADPRVVGKTVHLDRKNYANRALQRGRLHSGAADQRVWDSHGLGRPARPCTADRFCLDSGKCRERDWGRTGAHAGPEYGPGAVGKRQLARSRHSHCGCAPAELRVCDCLRNTGVARLQSRSDDGAAL